MTVDDIKLGTCAMKTWLKTQSCDWLPVNWPVNSDTANQHKLAKLVRIQVRTARLVTVTWRNKNKPPQFKNVLVTCMTKDTDKQGLLSNNPPRIIARQRSPVVQRRIFVENALLR